MSISMLASGIETSDYEPSLKKLKYLVGRQDFITDVQTHLEPTEEAALKALILDSCSFLLQLCKELSNQLYHSLLDGLVWFFYLLYDKDELSRTLHSHTLFLQRTKFWEELGQECEPFVKMREKAYEACKWIVSKKDYLNRYSLLNESDIARLLMRYKNCSEVKPSFIMEYYDDDKECVESAIDDDIQKAIRKAKFCPRLSDDLYTSLLLDMVTGECTEYQDCLVEKAVGEVNVEAFHGLDPSSIEELRLRDINSFDEFYEHIKIHFMRIFIHKKLMVRKEANVSALPYFLLFDIELFMGPSGETDQSKVVEYHGRVGQRPSVGLFHLIKVAELRRKAEGSCFIKREHFLWAFEVSGWGLRTAIKGELASRIPAEGCGHPAYHIYRTAIMLAVAVQEPVEAEHLAFAVFFAKNFVFSEEEVKQMMEDFKIFRTALRKHCGCPLKDWSQVMVE